MINSNSKETELGSVFDDQTMKANDKVITTIYCLIFIIGLVCNVSGIGFKKIMIILYIYILFFVVRKRLVLVTSNDDEAASNIAHW